MTVYAPPGTEGSVVSYEARYDNWIGGKRVAPCEGPVPLPENVSPVNSKPFCEVARSTAEDIELALDAAHAAVPAWGKMSVASAQTSSTKIALRMETTSKAIAVARLGKRQAGPGDPGRGHPAGDRPLQSTSQAFCAGRKARSPRRRRHDRLPLPRAARRGRTDHPVELPDPDGDVEVGAGPGRRQRVVLKARRADPGLDHVADGPRGRPAAGCAEHRQRLRCRGGQAAGAATTASARSPSPVRPPPAG